MKKPLPRTKNKAFISAYLKGKKAFNDGFNARPPYADWRTNRGAVTFSRAFIHYWQRGYSDAKEESGESVVSKY